MKTFIFILFFLPLLSMAQNVPDSLHKYTDSFMFYRCQVKCKEPKAGGFYLNKREKYRELAQHYYNLFDAQRTRTHVRFRDPNHYAAPCPCQAPDTLLAHLQDSLDFYREEWEFSGRQNQVYQRKMFYFSNKISDRSWQNYINKAKKP
jgi:hypothetical protein